MATICIVDLGALYWRSYHASGANDLPDECARATVDYVRRASSHYDHVAVACDSRTSWRRELAPTYKANRDEKPAAALEQLRRAEEMLEEDGFALLRADGYEADDIIAGVAWAYAHEHHVTIATVDKDLHQLVRGDAAEDAGVSIRRIDTGAVMGHAETVAKFGVTPEQIGDLLALMGDASDNVPGVPGIGAKTAAKLLQAYGSIAGIKIAIQQDDQRITPKTRDAFATADEQLGTSRRLVSLVPPEMDYAAVLAPRVPRPVKSATQKQEEQENVTQTEQSPEVEGEVVRPPPVKPAAPPVAALAVVQAEPGTGRWNMALEPSSGREAMVVARALFNSRLLGSFPTEEAVYAAILNGRSLGLGAMASIRGTHVIEGKLALSAQTIVGMVMASGLADYIRCESSSATEATWSTRRRGHDKEQRRTFTIEDAQRAGYLKPRSNWEKIPQTMLEWRCAVTLARREYPDIVGGLYTPEELRDHSTNEERAA